MKKPENNNNNNKEKGIQQSIWAQGVSVSDMPYQFSHAGVTVEGVFPTAA